jgi:pyrroloquinoline quinone (PQQ) biosynthesis protein C
MHYLLEHYGETGAEAQHERNAIDAIASVLDDSNRSTVEAGADAFLLSLSAMWDLLDSALLASGASMSAKAAAC